MAFSPARVIRFSDRPGTAGKHDVDATLLLQCPNGDLRCLSAGFPGKLLESSSGTELVPLFAAVKRLKKGANLQLHLFLENLAAAPRGQCRTTFNTSINLIKAKFNVGMDYQMPGIAIQ
jgi:hypothetical protein